MPLVPVFVQGRIRLALLEGGKITGREAERFAEEQARIQLVQRRRMYYDGTQYDEDNYLAAQACGINIAAGQRLPEHERLNAYSTQIAESVDFIADQLSDGFRVEPENPEVAAVVEAMVAATDLLSGGDEEEEISSDDLLTDALVAGDVPYEMVWDPIEGVAFPQFWECEQVEFIVPRGTHVEKVVLREIEWVDDPAFGGEESRQVQKRYVYQMAMNPAGYMECRKDEFWDSEDEPRSSTWLGLPMIPWGLMRANRRSMRVFRGESIIKDKAMDNADRYDAVEQHSYLISRYNSHGNLAVSGDAAVIELKGDGAVKKDVADVLTFPGGTQVSVITLPTDPEMIEHQRKVTSDAIYATFGLTRVEPDTLSGLGGVTGYALEILNRKTEGTFRRVRRQWRKDWLNLIGLALDVTAYKEQARVQLLNLEDGSLTDVDIEDLDIAVLDEMQALVPVVAFWDVDPAVRYPTRKIKIQMGSGYIVDDVALRDDFTADLVSRRYALEQRGLGKDDIDDIEDQIRDQPTGAENGAFGVAPATGTQAGGTVGGTTSRQ